MTKITKFAFSINGLSILIGVLGFMSSIVTMFVDVNSQIPVKILLFSATLSLILISVLLSHIFTQKNETREIFDYAVPFMYEEKYNLYLVRKNPIFSNNVVAVCYEKDSEFEIPVFIGSVQWTQSDYLQIKPLKYLKKDHTKTLEKLFFRNSITLEMIKMFEEVGLNDT